MYTTGKKKHKQLVNKRLLGGDARIDVDLKGYIMHSSLSEK